MSKRCHGLVQKNHGRMNLIEVSFSDLTFFFADQENLCNSNERQRFTIYHFALSLRKNRKYKQTWVYTNRNMSISLMLKKEGS